MKLTPDAFCPQRASMPYEEKVIRPTVLRLSHPLMKRGQTRFNALPLDVVTAYWLYQSSQGNQQALALVWALLSESLERRFDDAFGVIRTEQERNETTTTKIKTLEKALANLGEGFAINDEIRRERDYYESLLKQNGIEPYGLPNSDR
jgi:hypothetical protein